MHVKKLWFKIGSLIHSIDNGLVTKLLKRHIKQIDSANNVHITKFTFEKEKVKRKKKNKFECFYIYKMMRNRVQGELVNTASLNTAQQTNEIK